MITSRALLAKARENEAASCYPRVWMKSAMVERELGHAAAERGLLTEGLRCAPPGPGWGPVRVRAGPWLCECDCMRVSAGMCVCVPEERLCAFAC